MLFTLTGLILASVLGCSSSSPPAPRHLVLVSIDTLRADHLGVYGYGRNTSPRMDALARSGVVFENAWAQWPKTTPSMVSMFTGTYPHENGIVVVARPQWVPDEMVMLPEVLAEHGFRTGAVVANSVLGQESNFPQGFAALTEAWLDPAPRSIAAENVTNEALAMLDVFVASGDRFFLWVHYQDPHTPYIPPDAYFEPFLDDELFESRSAPRNAGDDPHYGISEKVWSNKRFANSDDVGYYVARYDGEIRFLDEHLGRLFDRLETTVGDETLIAITADHGESLGEHDYYFHHGHFPYEADVRVPLIFRWPGGRFGGRRVVAPVELRGLAATVLDALAVSRGGIGGPSLISAIKSGDASSLPPNVFTAAGSAATFEGATYTLAVRAGERKLVMARSDWARSRHGAEIELYDLRSDPHEVRNLALVRADETANLKDELRSWWERVPPVPPLRMSGDEVQYREETVRNLRELGYLQ